MTEQLDFEVELERLLGRLMNVLFMPMPEDPLYDVPLAQLRIMRLLFAGDQTPSDIGGELGLSTSAITQIANRMERSGLVERRNNPDDRRERPLGLTESGMAQMQRRRRNRVERAATALAGLDGPRRQQILDALQELFDVAAASRKKDSESIVTLAEIEASLPPVPIPKKREQETA